MENKKTNVVSIQFSKEVEIPLFVDKVMSGNRYASYGDGNDIPSFLYGLYENSAILQSLINGTADYVFGTEFKVDKMNKCDVRKIILDYLIFGGFCIQVYYSKGQISKLEWRDFIKCRKDIDETKVFYSNQWGRYKSKAIEFPIWDPSVTEGTAIYYYKGNKTRGIYPIPIWNGALKSVIISTEISNFHFHNILNGFNSNVIVNFNNGKPDSETQTIIEEQFKDTFCGTNNAGRFMMSFNDDTEHAVTVERIPSDDFDQKYQSLSEFVRADIFTAFRATPNLFGLPTETTGFSAQEYTEAFKLYNKTVVEPIQNEFQDVFNEMGISTLVTPFQINFDSNV